MSWKLTRRRAWICVGLLVCGSVVVAVACEGGLLVVESGGAGGAGAASLTPIVLSNGVPSSAADCDSDSGDAYTCAEAVAPGGEPAKLCGESKEAMFYDGLVWCGCVSACRDACALDACAGMEAGGACLACLSNFANGCEAELSACFDGDAGAGQ